MIAAYEDDPVRVPHFQCEQEEKRLDRVQSAIDKVAHKEVLGIRAWTADAKQLQEIVKLPMNVATDRDGRIHVLDIPFFDEQLACTIT